MKTDSSRPFSLFAPALAFVGVSFILLLGFGSLQAKITGESPYMKSWLVCKTNVDCTIVKGVCGGWDCVNTEHAAEALRLNKKFQKEYGCGGQISKKAKPSVFCGKGICKCKDAAKKSTSGW